MCDVIVLVPDRCLSFYYAGNTKIDYRFGNNLFFSVVYYNLLINSVLNNPNG